MDGKHSVGSCIHTLKKKKLKKIPPPPPPTAPSLSLSFSISPACSTTQGPFGLLVGGFVMFIRAETSFAAYCCTVGDTRLKRLADDPETDDTVTNWSAASAVKIAISLSLSEWPSTTREKYIWCLWQAGRWHNTSHIWIKKRIYKSEEMYKTA